MHAIRNLLQRALAQIYHIAGSPARSIIHTILAGRPQPVPAGSRPLE